jgi:ADP-ribose pyrophosphatase
MDTIYKGRVFSVEVGRKRFPNGQDHEVAIVRHPPSVVLIPIQDDGQVILIRQYRPSVDRELWEVPAGSLDPGEKAEAAAARECEEEIGLVPHTIERLQSLFPTPGFCDEELIFFRVSDLRAPAPDSTHRPDEDEDIVMQPFAVAEARAMVEGGAIVDLKTAYALTLLGPVGPPARSTGAPLA